MSWQDRDYYRGDAGFSQPGRMGFGFPRPTRVVKYLLIINFGVFVVESLSRIDFVSAFELSNRSAGEIFQIWRLVSYQFFHGGVGHIFFNMIGLYFLGPQLERLWGGRKFLVFYLACGVVAGLAFFVISFMTGQPATLIGASGSILGILAACAVLFPQFVIILLFFPVPIRVAAILFGVFYSLSIIREGDLSDAAHFGGMAAGLFYVLVLPKWRQRQTIRQSGRWQKRLEAEEAEQEKIDHILDKVHEQGINSLSRRERRMLRKATERQREQDRQRGNNLRRR